MKTVTSHKPFQEIEYKLKVTGSNTSFKSLNFIFHNDTAHSEPKPNKLEPD